MTGAAESGGLYQILSDDACRSLTTSKNPHHEHKHQDAINALINACALTGKVCIATLSEPKHASKVLK